MGTTIRMVKCVEMIENFKLITGSATSSWKRVIVGANAKKYVRRMLLKRMLGC